MAYGVLYDFLMGQSIEAYKYFGPHFVIDDDKEGVIFRVYAPMAKEVSLIGEFNNWNPGSHVMKKVDDAGVYEVFVQGAKDYQSYKYHILTMNNEYIDKQDPFATYGEYRPGSCSRLFNVEDLGNDDTSHKEIVKQTNAAVRGRLKSRNYIDACGCKHCKWWNP